jgi:hypothetical protein
VRLTDVGCVLSMWGMCHPCEEFWGVYHPCRCVSAMVRLGHLLFGVFTRYWVLGACRSCTGLC